MNDKKFKKQLHCVLGMTLVLSFAVVPSWSLPWLAWRVQISARTPIIEMTFPIANVELESRYTALPHALI